MWSVLLLPRAHWAKFSPQSSHGLLAEIGDSYQALLRPTTAGATRSPSRKCEKKWPIFFSSLLHFSWNVSNVTFPAPYLIQFDPALRYSCGSEWNSPGQPVRAGRGQHVGCKARWVNVGRAQVPSRRGSVCNLHSLGQRELLRAHLWET